MQRIKIFKIIAATIILSLSVVDCAPAALSAVKATNGAQRTVAASSVIIAKSTQLDWAAVYAAKGGAKITMKTGVTTESYGYGVRGVWAESNAYITMDAAKIYTYGDNASGIYALGNQNHITSTGTTSIRIGGNGSCGVRISGNGLFEASALHIETKGNESHGMQAKEKGARIQVAGKLDITTAGTTSHGVHAKNGGSIYLLKGGTVRVTQRDKSKAIVAEATNAESSYIEGQGIFNITGNILSSSSSSGKSYIGLKLDDGSSITGAASATGENSTVNIALKGANSTWKISSNSKISELGLDGATVDFRNSAAKTVLTTQNLVQGNGTFIMKAVVADEISDRIRVNGYAYGDYRIRVINSGGDRLDGTQKIVLAQAANGDASFALEYATEIGAWQYTINKKPLSSYPAAWWLELKSEDQVDTDSETNPEDDTDQDDEDDLDGEDNLDSEDDSEGEYKPGGEDNQNGENNSGGNGGGEWELEQNGSSSNAASSAISTFSAAYLMSYAETHTLHQRLGDLRVTNAKSGVWFRAHGGKFESASKNFVREFDMKYGGIQLGYDRKVSGADGDLYVGTMFGYGKGDLKYLYSGKGEVDSKTVGVYATYSGANGAYADLTLKYQWMDNKFDVLDTAGDRVTGDSVRTGGPGASLEIGRRFHFNADKKLGWYLTPHAQLSYSRQDGGTFRASNGLTISVDGFTSLIGRAGIAVGYDNGFTNFYFKAVREKEFDGEVNIIANGEMIPEDFGGSRWLFGIGLTSKLNDRNSIYFTLDRTEGDSFSRPWAINAGWRITL